MNFQSIIYVFLCSGTVNFNHKNGCQKCEVTGEYDSTYRHMSYHNIDAPRRTNESFRARQQPTHHTISSPLEELEINMINAFTVCDPLHLLHHGVMKKLLLRWVGKVKGYCHKWKKSIIESVSQYLLAVKNRMPEEIHRPVRPLSEMSKWKGVEFRSFLMYVGITALKPVLNAQEYDHFLLLFCACTIVSCKFYKAYIPLATDLFKAFVLGYIKLYGQHSISSNVHNLIHITEDLIKNQIDSIEELSTYKYENCLRLLTMKLQNNGKPLEQISRRLIELFHFSENFFKNKNLDTINDHDLCPHVEYELPSEKNCFRKITIKPGVTLSNRKIGDRWFLTRSNEIVEFKHALKVGDSYKICGFPLISKEIFFEKPIASSHLSIFKSDGKLNSKISVYEISFIKSKMITLPIESNFVYIPILHTLESLN